MKKIIALSLFFAAAGCVPAAEPAFAYDIYEDDGGLVDLYAYAVKSPEPVRVFGVCQSSCTMLLGARDVCVSPASRFMFHAARAGENNYRLSVSGTEEMFDHYSPALLQYIAAHGGLTTRRELWVSGAALIAMGYKACS